MNVFSKELPVSEFLNFYTQPPYNTIKETYFGFRPFFEQVALKYPESVGVEIGVYEGYNTLGICRFCNPKKVYLVDPYSVYEEVIENIMSAYDQEYWNCIYECARKRLEGYPVEFIRAISTEGANLVPNELDYAYIDGDHSVKSVVKDIDTWYPKVKINGLIGGHDTLEPEVQQGIATWLYKHPEYGNTFKFKWNDWWIIK